MLNWLSCVFIWPIKVLNACCIAYFFKFVATQENSAESPTPTPIQNRGDPIFEGGGGTEIGGLTPTEDVSRLLEEEILAKRSTSNFSTTGRRGALKRALTLEFWLFLEALRLAEHRKRGNRLNEGAVLGGFEWSGGERGSE